MKVAMIGFGNAGGKVIDKCVQFERETGRDMIAAALAVNTATTDLERLEHLPPSSHLVIGQADVHGQGVGADNQRGAEIAESDLPEIRRALHEMPVHEVDAFLVAAGLGGGTGSGGAPVLAHEIARVFDKPVYGLGILPGRQEGGLYSHNAATSFQSMAKATDSLIVFDNDSWKESGDSLRDGYDHINEQIAERLVVLLSAGEVDDSDVAENVVDSNEIINTLGGISTIGYATSRVRSPTEAVAEGAGLLGRLRGNGGDEPAEKRSDPVGRIMTVTREAAHGQLTLPCDIASSERALVLMSGPPDHLSRKGVEEARAWVEGEADTSEVRGGDDPRGRATHLSGLVLFSGVTDAPRIDELKEQAVGAKRKREELEARSEERFEDLITDDDGELDPVV